ncbi:HAD domain-containing protein [Rathayibacter iranicus]|uniref:Uncharacterized protein n=2 Tax=Rathayibacter iranicus TaxID=59737 RepID=A0AAD1AEU0_9MICO|nr:HAD domain-containing protein [Rathayibacter iranicus]AZZ56092.1 hypothetical protein C7V51_09510 [Rathayibacter iranicus]MWV30216.1 hypothetical protein [Rathayibacter iranicus NCPPB 2253 = VKM Ac-1602]PPI46160.1 hypothetical protein C5E09_08510 [Rathayibacter iranicus]PPI59534.1 hypothetical protein C5E08_09430 [Rathayibacter iranicus]PPI71012.1 hypothetical protein C5E01_08475 [Rathayibacter iranicus]
MAALILLDVDGVLNPSVRSDRAASSHRLELAPAREELVRRLAAVGTVVWATTWPPRLTSVLTEDLGLPSTTEAIVFDGGLPHDPRFPGQTGKLEPVAAWLDAARGRGPIDAVVWIDDNLREDAYAWAREQSTPFHLVRPDSAAGMTSDEVAGAEEFLAALPPSHNDIRE